MRLLCLLLAVLLLPAPLLHAASELERANQLYEAGKYKDAIAAYEGARRGGERGANVFLNLGNAWLRLGDRGRAILNYERALALAPLHPEATANLAFARRAAGSPAPERGPWLSRASAWGSDALTLGACGGFWLALLGLVAAFGPARRRTVGLAVGLAGLAVCVAGTSALLALGGGERNPARAIVLKETPARFGPADNQSVARTLPPGAEVHLLSKHGAWVYAELLPDRARAWLPAKEVARVVPDEAAPKG